MGLRTGGGRRDVEQLDSDSVSTDKGDINQLKANDPLYPAQDPRELLKFVDIANSSSISATVSGLPRNELKPIIIEVLRYKDDTSNNNNLELVLENQSGYDFTQEDETGSVTTTTGASAYTLIEPTASTSADEHVAEFSLTVKGSYSSVGRSVEGSPLRGVGKYLKQSVDLNSPVGPYDLTLQASASSADLDLRAAIWQVQDRGVI